MKVFTYKKCGSCQKAVKWLNEREIEFDEIAIRETPPSVDELSTMLGFLNGELKRLFNTSGMDYRALDMKTKLPNLSVDEALNLLAANGNLVKRPFVLGADFGLVGFKPADWSACFE